ncbi:MAG: NEW3 domain-containing protein [Lachnospiraceae bacterium]|nr:NEW3 domain-containing protein [Lachnospiraceae bacterium]
MKQAKAVEIIREYRRRALIWLTAVSLMTVALITMWIFPARAEGGLDLNTQYPGISAKPGDSLSIPIQIDNGSGAGMEADVAIRSLPENWEGYLQGGSYQVSRVYVKPGEDGAELTLHVTLPDQLEEGTYTAEVQAVSSTGVSDHLEIQFVVNEKEAGKGSFTSEYPEQEGASGTDFSFSTTLINNGLKPQSYSLSSNAPSGWNVSFTPSGETTKVAAIQVESGVSQGLNVSVAPPETVDAGEYQISCSAVSAEETLNLDLTVTITGTYGIALGTPDGRLSFDAHANKESDVTLQIQNTGNVDLENVSLNSTAPSGWTVTYDTEDNIIESIPAGTTTEVIAHVKPSSDAITGDYVTSFSVKTNEVSDNAEFRVSVKTSTVWGIVAVLLILCTAGGLGYVFKKYGRR